MASNATENATTRARARDLIQRESERRLRAGARERPMLFSDAMVRAILSGTKTQTRRCARTPDSAPSRIMPGDRIWVRECWCQYDPTDRSCVVYRADISEAELAEERAVRREMGCRTHAPWRPSIFMPRWASRITLQVTEVRAQRLHDISNEDVAAEGVTAYLGEMRINGERATGFMSAQRYFAGLWNSINGKREGCSWEDNPAVHAITFRVLQLYPAVHPASSSVVQP